MGQGLYTMIALGTTSIPERPPAVEEDDWYGWSDALDTVTEGRIRDQYEAEPPYLAIPLAISDGFLQEYWRVPVELDRAVLPVAELSAFVADHLENATRLWKQAQEEVRKTGRELPDAVLLIINDWD